MLIAVAPQGRSHWAIVSLNPSQINGVAGHRRCQSRNRARGIGSRPLVALNILPGAITNALRELVESVLFGPPGADTIAATVMARMPTKFARRYTSGQSAEQRKREPIADAEQQHEPIDAPTPAR